MYTLPALGYEYNALAPHISADIMKLHHTKHHQTYVDKLNAATERITVSGSVEDLLRSLDTLPPEVRGVI